MVMSQEMLSFNLEEADKTLIKPVKELVKVAKNRVREGRLNFNGLNNSDEQVVFLLHEKSDRVFKIIDPLVKKIDGEVVSTGGDLGLYISGFQLNNTQRFPPELKKIRVPNDTRLVTRKSLFLLRAHNVIAIELLTKELRESVKVTKRSLRRSVVSRL